MPDRPSIAWLLAPLVCLLWLYAPMPGVSFVFDDRAAVVENPMVSGETPWSEALVRDFWGERPGYQHIASWRPLTVWSLRLDFMRGDGQAVAFRWTNVALLAALATFMGLLLYVLGGSRWLLVMCSATVGVHPIFSEATASIVGRGDLLAALWGLIGLGFALITPQSRRHTGAIAAICAVAIALLCKETGVVYGLALLLFWLRRGENAMALALTGLIASWYGARALVVGGLGGDVSPLDNPIVTLDGVSAVLTGLGIVGRYTLYLVVPQHVAADHAAGVSFGASDALVGLVALISLGVMSVRLWFWPAESKAAQLTFIGAGLTGVSLLLLSNLVVTLPTPLAGRLALHPAMGCCVMGAGLGLWIVHASPSRQRLVGILASVWLLAGVPGTLTTVEAWASDDALFEAALEAEPGSVRSRANLANQRIKQGRLEEAEALLIPALERHPDHPLALTNRAVIQLRRGEIDRAWASASRAIEHRGASGVAHANACAIALTYKPLPNTKRIALCRHARALRPNAPEPLVNLARTLIMDGQISAGTALFEEAVLRHPAHPFVLGHFVTELIRRGDLDAAIVSQRQLLRVEATPANHKNLVALVMRAGREAFERGRADAACAYGREALDLTDGAPRLQRLTAPWCP